MTLYMRSKPYKPLVYVAVWEAECIVKAGFTGGDRWKKFRPRGARIAHLFTKDGSIGGIRAVALEQLLESELMRHGTRAFRDKASAAPYLATQGGGYTECYRIPPEMLAHVVEHVLPGIAKAHAFSTSTDVTDGRTNEDRVHFKINLTKVTRTSLAEIQLDGLGE